MTEENLFSPLIALSEDARNIALQRFRTIQPYLEDGIALRNIVQQGVSVRTARRWIKSYRQSGLSGLAKKERLDAGSVRIDKRLRDFIETLSLSKPRKKLSSIYRQVKAHAEKLQLKPPSYSSVRVHILRMGEPIHHLAHEGKSSFINRYDLVHCRSASAPNEIWQADHTPLDILVLDKNSKPARPWLTIILDDHSRAICGYSINLESPSAMNTALVLHQAIWRKPQPQWKICGIPEQFYTDHGSDFTSKHLEQVAADLKMQLIFSTVAQPRGRGKIERFFRSVNQLFLSDLPGYLLSQDAALLTLPDLDQRFRNWLLANYLSAIHSQTKQAPHARWESSGFLPRMPASLEQLDLLLLTVSRPRVIHPDGIHFHNFKYMSTTLAAYVREQVVIRYDPRDLAQIRVFHENRFLCVATCAELSGVQISLKEITRARNDHRKQLAKTIKEKRGYIEQFVAVHHPAPPFINAPKQTQSNKLRLYEND